MSRVGGSDGGVHAARSEPGVDQHDHRTGPPAGVQRHRQIDPGRNHQRHAIAHLDTAAGQSGRRRLHQLGELGIGDAAGVARHLGDSEFGAELGVRVEQRRCPVVGRAGSHRPVERAEPVDDRSDGVDVLGDEVTGVRVAVDVGVREPAFEVVQVEIGEHLVLRTPQQQRRYVPKQLQIGGDAIQRGGARMIGVERDVGHELGDRGPPGRGEVGRQKASPDVGGRALIGHLERTADERRRAHRDVLEHRPRTRQADQARGRRSSRLVHGRVHQHHAHELFEMTLRPTERDRPTPVVGDGDHRTGDLHRLGQLTQVVDPLRQSPYPATALGEPHLELIDGDHPNPVGRRADEVAVQVRPRRVAVHTQHGQLRVRHLVVEHVPGSPDPVGDRHVDQPRPARLEAGQTAGWEAGVRRGRLGHHCSSSTPAFSPDPIPRHNTVSPGDRLSASLANVIGTAAGPMLP